MAKWSAFDYMPADTLPYIGYAYHGTKTIFTATGFQKWGHTNVRRSWPCALLVNKLPTQTMVFLLWYRATPRRWW